jgi:hypothetical protein
MTGAYIGDGGGRFPGAPAGEEGLCLGRRTGWLTGVRDDGQAGVMTKGAVDELVALLDEVPSHATDIEVCAVLGRLLWCRYLAFDPPGNERELHVLSSR